MRRILLTFIILTACSPKPIEESCKWVIHSPPDEAYTKDLFIDCMTKPDYKHRMWYCISTKGKFKGTYRENVKIKYQCELARGL
jgi:hypothetical protein